MQFPIRQEIEVLPADEPKMIEYGIRDRFVITSKGRLEELPEKAPFRLGWTVRETIGVAVVNTRGLMAGRKSVIIG